MEIGHWCPNTLHNFLDRGNENIESFVAFVIYFGRSKQKKEKILSHFMIWSLLGFF